jgi:hypothetical protein
MEDNMKNAKIGLRGINLDLGQISRKALEAHLFGKRSRTRGGRKASRQGR